MASKQITFHPPPGSIQYPDSNRYKGGFGVRSQSSDRIYKISFDVAQSCWVCSCPGCIRHGHCKHLQASGLKGRKYGKQQMPLFVRADK